MRLKILNIGQESKYYVKMNQHTNVNSRVSMEKSRPQPLEIQEGEGEGSHTTKCP